MLSLSRLQPTFAAARVALAIALSVGALIAATRQSVRWRGDAEWGEIDRTVATDRHDWDDPSMTRPAAYEDERYPRAMISRARTAVVSETESGTPRIRENRRASRRAISEPRVARQEEIVAEPVPRKKPAPPSAGEVSPPPASQEEPAVEDLPPSLEPSPGVALESTSGSEDLPAPSGVRPDDSAPALEGPSAGPTPAPSRRRAMPAPPAGWPTPQVEGATPGSVPGTDAAPGMFPPEFVPGIPSIMRPLPEFGPRAPLAPSTGPPRWADKPRLGEHWHKPPPEADCAAVVIDADEGDFSRDPIQDDAYDSCQQELPYYGKKFVPRAQPFWVFGRSFYDYGPYAPAPTFFGRSNLLLPQFMGFGDIRTAVASNRNVANDFNTAAGTINLDMDLRLTSTERIHAFVTPFARNGSFSRLDFNSRTTDFVDEKNFNLLAGYFEGDLGAIAGGATNRVLPFDLPFAVGGMPLVFQNGVWMEDIVTGAAVTIPARNSPLLRISNMDLTFFTAWDGITSPAFQNNSAAKFNGVASWIEAWGGYLETDYAFVEDRSSFRRSYHNFGIGWTRRYGKWWSNSVRWIGNFGQDPLGIDRTAHGSIVLIENSLITQQPSNWVPYFNLWGGFGRPQSLARAGVAGGILRNTGILFESDNLTGYPTLDPSGQNTYGAALGLNLIKLDFSRQFVVEVGTVQTMGRAASRQALGQEYGLGLRYQRNISNASLLRLDGMYGLLSDGPRDISGARIEWRMKF